MPRAWTHGMTANAAPSWQNQSTGSAPSQGWARPVNVSPLQKALAAMRGRQAPSGRSSRESPLRGQGSPSRGGAGFGGSFGGAGFGGGGAGGGFSGGGSAPSPVYESGYAPGETYNPNSMGSLVAAAAINAAIPGAGTLATIGKVIDQPKLNLGNQIVGVKPNQPAAQPAPGRGASSITRGSTGASQGFGTNGGPSFGGGGRAGGGYNLGASGGNFGSFGGSSGFTGGNSGGGGFSLGTPGGYNFGSFGGGGKPMINALQ